MKSLNRVTLIGNVGKVELKHTQTGTACLNISLATTTSYKDNNEQWQDKTEWHRAVFWGKRAESISQYIQKGNKLYIEGRLETIKWQTQDGQDRYTTQINISDIVLLGGNNKGENSTNNQPQQANNEDIPF